MATRNGQHWQTGSGGIYKTFVNYCTFHSLSSNGGRGYPNHLCIISMNTHKNRRLILTAAMFLCAALVVVVLNSSVAAGTNNPAGSSTSPVESIVAPGTKLEKLAGGFAFTEGATCDSSGDVFFVDQP